MHPGTDSSGLNVIRPHAGIRNRKSTSGTAFIRQIITSHAVYGMQTQDRPTGAVVQHYYPL
jgi:hypothetical protein